MRLGVLDIGSNTAHLLVVDAYRGAPPLPAYSYKDPLQLTDHLDDSGAVTPAGVDALVKFVADAQQVAEDKGATSVLAFATSAIRDAVNSDDVLRRVLDEAETELVVLSGDVEARLTFLAVRRWFGWSSGHLGVFDIGGGSLEIAAGSDEHPTVALSLPLGAGRLTRNWIQGGGAPDQEQLRGMRRHVRAEIAEHVGMVKRGGDFVHAVATSKTFRSLARMAGAAPSSDGPYVRRVLTRVDLQSLLAELETLSADEVAQLPGVSAHRAHQMVTGAVVADAVLDLFGLEELEICPWALREGVILEHLDRL
ncbi:Ppx/GppA phosphatase family protein [Solicola gregarius]|uniref:Ppx/GppA family phosphatase n=1 Tax=Solicola gregarius TaxID=2908642 RepID=A0AA46TKG7_9ACTN|nr:Ppx/GppA phosphatase family protein [Solicola gregarius]UYM06961.1 Ppx/GppA family phosphatase [Solicola gregarius]